MSHRLRVRQGKRGGQDSGEWRDTILVAGRHRLHIALLSAAAAAAIMVSGHPHVRTHFRGHGHLNHHRRRLGIGHCDAQSEADAQQSGDDVACDQATHRRNLAENPVGHKRNHGPVTSPAISPVPDRGLIGWDDGDPNDIADSRIRKAIMGFGDRAVLGRALVCGLLSRGPIDTRAGLLVDLRPGVVEAEGRRQNHRRPVPVRVE